MAQRQRHMTDSMSVAAKRARADYAKEWRRNNPDKQKAITARYWERKAAQSNQTPTGDKGGVNNG